MFNEYDVVRLKKPLTKNNLFGGEIGTILAIYNGEPQEYEVEFVDKDGETVAVATVEESDIEMV